MLKCNVCQIDKNENEFQKYWHSTQKVFRIRKQCTSCFYLKRRKDKLIEVSIPTEIVQPVVPELEPVVLEEEHDTEIFKQCSDCGEWKLKEENFTKYGNTKGYFKRCRKCTNEIEKDKYYQEVADKGGSDRISNKVGVFHDQYQKEQTHQFLRLLGWKENSEGVWFKEPYKTEEGVWIKFNEEKRIGRRYRGKGEKGQRKQKTKKYIAPEIVDGVLEMTRSGCKIVRITEKYKISKFLIWRIREENQLI